MAFTGYLSKFSLPEIFEFLEQGYKTGLLSIRALKMEQMQQAANHYIWLRQGRIVAAANNLDNQGLVSMINRRGWVSKNSAMEKFEASGGRMAMGLCLKSQGLLTAEQLTLLFRSQIMGQVSALFELENGKFDFDFHAPMPAAEMTGLSMLTNDATIKGLRSLRNWSALQAKLPDLTSGISKKTMILSQLQLDPQESKVWQYANGKTSLNEIANLVLIPVEKVQQIAFRLIVSNLAEEAFIIDTPKTPIIDNRSEFNEFADLNSTNGFGELSAQTFAADLPSFNHQETAYAVNTKERETTQVEENVPAPVENNILDSVPNSSSEINVSQSFLQNLVGFLKTKVET
ncbi:MAG: DUF4388 domain-containing protein [Rivularia sp. ALOHA_DT_140]|nr:DUF4388 domain-containing protein [Rivularia sp. ALOHA_DT_140]